MTEPVRITAAEYRAQNARVGKRPRKHKYGAKACMVDGIKFPSKAEALRYNQLQLKVRAREIVDLKLQPRFSLSGSGPTGGDVADYVADFSYQELDAHGRYGAMVVEDVKGVLTAVYRLKIKLFKAQYSWLTFREIKAPSRRRRKRTA